MHVYQSSDVMICSATSYTFICVLFLKGGDLDAKINELSKSKKHLEETTILDWFVQLVLAVHYMHTRRVLHRDLKSRLVQ